MAGYVAATGTEPTGEPEQESADRPRRITAPVSAGDRVFRGILRAGGLSVFAIMGLIAFFLLYRGALEIGRAHV